MSNPEADIEGRLPLLMEALADAFIPGNGYALRSS